MNRKNLLEQIQNKMIKLQYEGSLRPYTQQPLTGEEMQTPIGQLGKGRKTPDIDPAVTTQAPQPAPLIGKPMPAVDNIKDQSDKMRYKKEYAIALRAHYSMAQREASRFGETANFAEEFDVFKQNASSRLRLIKNELEKKLRQEAIAELSNEIRQKGIEAIEDVDLFKLQEEQQKKQEQEIKQRKTIRNYTKKEVENLINLNARNMIGEQGKTKESLAIRYLKQTPEFNDNEHNLELLEQIEKEGFGAHAFLVPLDITADQRNELVDLFIKSYLDRLDTDTIADKKRKEQNWAKLSSYKTEIEIDDKERDAFDFDSVGYIQKNLFYPGVHNKEPFMQFWLTNSTLVKSRLTQLADKMMQEVSESGEQSRIPEIEAKWQTFLSNFGEGKDLRRNAKAFEFLQAPSLHNSVAIEDAEGYQTSANIFVEELKKIMQNTGDPLHELFFNFVHGKLRREAQSQAFEAAQLDSEREKIISDQESAFKSEDVKVSALVEKSRKQNSLNSCRELPELQIGSPVTPNYIECLQEDWQKISTYKQMIDAKLMQKYQKARDNVEKVKCLQKMLLWSKMFEVFQKMVNQVIGSSNQGDLKITSDLERDVLNRHWYAFYSGKRIEAINLHIDDLKVAEICELGAQDLTDLNAIDVNDKAAEVYARIMPGKMEGYLPFEQILEIYRQIVNSKLEKDPGLQKLVSQYGQDSNAVREYLHKKYKKDDQVDTVLQLTEKNMEIQNTLHHQARENLHEFSDVLLSPDILAELGGSLPLTFCELLKIDDEAVRFGVLFARKNFQSYKDKIDFLDEFMRRPAEAPMEKKIRKNKQEETFDVAREDLEKLTPTEIDTIFQTIRDVLSLVYGTQRPLEAAIKNPDSIIKDSDVAELAQAAGVAGVNSKADYAKASKAQKNEIETQFISSNIGKFYVETVRVRNALIAWLARFIEAKMDEHPNPSEFLQSINLDPEKTLQLKGVQRYKRLIEDLDKLQLRDVLRTCSTHFPLLLQAYQARRITKTNADENKEPTSEIITKAMQNYISQGFDTPATRKQLPAGLKPLYFFAQVLDVAGDEANKP